jgi:hypothetical protein
MFSRHPGLTGACAALLALGVLAAIIMGCGGISPFLSAQFASTLANIPRGPRAPDLGGGDVTDTGTAIGSICEVQVGQRIVQVVIRNEAQQFVRFRITFITSAGPGGFVCDAERPNYENGGYAPPPGGGNTFTVGCDTITSPVGSTLLVREFFGRLDPNVGGDPAGILPQVVLSATGGNPNIPIPEIIAFGSVEDDFECTTTNDPVTGIQEDLCTQRGFVYGNISDVPIGKAADVVRVQGTVCNTGLGTAPEWRLDKTLLNGTVQPFQFPIGGTITANILDRANDAPTLNRNQVVWTVLDSADNTVHNPQP